MRNSIARLEAAMLQLPQVDLPVEHWFAPGIYARRLLIHKGVTLTGAVHLKENVNFLEYGDITVLTSDGVKRIRAPAIIVSPAGVKRVGYAHENTIWTTFFMTDLTNPEEIVDKFTVKTFADLPPDFWPSLEVH